MPALEDDGVRVADSAAICLYLADRYAPGRLAPAPDDTDRGRFLFWMFFAPGAIEPAMAERAGGWTPNRGAHGWCDFEAIIGAWEGGLAGHPWILGDAFSAADVMLGSSAVFLRTFGMLPASPTLEAYADVVVLRHPEVGASANAARYSHKPVINAGDGIGEHPTQALLDLFTIQRELGKVDGLHVAMVGDLKYGRTVHSLARLLCLYDVEMSLVSPDILRLPEEVLDEVASAGKTFHETHAIEDVIENMDVLYVTRVQKERFSDLAEYESVRNLYEVTKELMARAKSDMILMHPLPRVGEIHYDVDADPRAAYFRQMENGMFIRMALLAAVLGKA